MITFPAWYVGGFPDRELVVMDLLQPFLDLIGPPAEAVAFLPADYQSRLPLVWVYRGGGSSDVGVLRDPAAVRVSVIADNRADSWAVLEYCRQMLLSFADGGHVKRSDDSFTMVQSIWELVGPSELPETSPDDRMVSLDFGVECKKPPTIPDYAVIRESLSL